MFNSMIHCVGPESPRALIGTREMDSEDKPITREDVPERAEALSQHNPWNVQRSDYFFPFKDLAEELALVLEVLELESLAALTLVDFDSHKQYSMTTLATKQAEFIVEASLAFLRGELAVSPKLVHEVQPFLLLVAPVGIQLVFVINSELCSIFPSIFYYFLHGFTAILSFITTFGKAPSIFGSGAEHAHGSLLGGITCDSHFSI